ncbi:MAG: hypothetical protein HYV07_17845 [Deltaproteobacteria bacterium]|nr:hypothetical protein [Deltaproteobacteria bacterium]
MSRFLPEPGPRTFVGPASLVWLAVAAASALASCGPSPIPAEELVATMDQHIGKRVAILGKWKSGARCRQGEDGEWKTYCKDCQYCRGPLVLDTTRTSSNSLDWPLVLAGSWEYQEIRCKGPLNEVKCHPLKEGTTYVVQGLIEAYKPPRLILEKFAEAD